MQRFFKRIAEQWLCQWWRSARLKHGSHESKADTQTHSPNQSAVRDGMSIFSPQYSACVEEALITLRSLKARPVLMHFLLFLSFSPPSAPSACFSADSGFWQSYLPFDPDQSPSYLQLVNYKHFIGSTLTLTDGARGGIGVKCLWRLVVGSLPIPRLFWASHSVELSDTAPTLILHSCRHVSARAVHSGACVFSLPMCTAKSEVCQVSSVCL